jgi:biotin carboxyl carrier protein
VSGNEERTVLFQLPTIIIGQLVCVQGSVVGRRWDLSAGTFVIGRSSQADLSLPSEPGVSKDHAKITAEGVRYVLTDSESRNGTIVNGKPVQRHVLADGDEIRVCNCVLRFSQRHATGSLELDAVAAARDDGETFEHGSNTSPERPGFTQEPPTQAPLSFEDVAPLPGDSPTRHASPSAPTQALHHADLPLEPVELLLPSERLEPLVVVQTKSPLPWFFAGLALMLLGGAGGWAGLRALVDDVPSPPVATPEPVQTVQPVDPVEPVAPVERVQPAGTKDEDPTVAEEELKPQAKPPADKDVRPPPARPTPRGPSRWYAVESQRSRPTPVRVKGSGEVASVEVSDGALVQKGQLLFAFDDAGSDEVANLKANIEALEAVAESQPSAQDMLDRERAKLVRLLSKSRGSRVTAPASGTLNGFQVKAGDRLSSGATVGSVAHVAGERLVIDALASDVRDARVGAAVEVKRRDGSDDRGKIAAVKKRGARVELTLEVSSPGDVVEARFP